MTLVSRDSDATCIEREPAAVAPAWSALAAERLPPSIFLTPDWISVARAHESSTTITLSGEYAGQADPEKKDRAPLIAKGYNKDHRPDLKQLLYCLTVSADGAVPGTG